MRCCRFSSRASGRSSLYDGQMNTAPLRFERRRWLLTAIIVLLFPVASGAEPSPPEVDGLWVRPAETMPAEPVWGHADGLRIGLWPLAGPRGLLRVYAPYLGHRDDRMINYIAIEPIVRGEYWRGFSELEDSQLDGIQGLRFWSADSPDDPSPNDPTLPCRGVVATDGDVETLTVYMFVEPYRSGARVYLRLRFRSDRPYEVGIATFTQPRSAELATCIVTATMGNFARLRTLHLRDGARTAAQLWPGFDGLDFTDRVCFSLDDLPRAPDGAALLVATPDEPDPASATYAPGTFVGWRYYGDVATQIWRREDPPSELRGCVNGRACYWASESPIPGGVAFENVELVEPFREGNEVWFAVVPGLYEPAPTLAPLDGG